MPSDERGAGDVLDALHQPDEPLVLVGAHRREADAAVAHHHRGDAVPARRREQRVPGDLAVVVRVDVDEAGRDEHAVGVDRPARRRRRRAVADLGDHAVVDRDVGRRGRRAGAVDDRAAADHEIVHGSPRRPEVGSRHHRTIEMCSTRVAIFERSCDTPDHGPGVPADRPRRRHRLAARRPPRRALSLAELTRRLGVNKSTGHAILTSLAAAGWVLRDPARKTYRLGPGARRARAHRAPASFPALDFARPLMAELSLEFAATCAALGRRRATRSRCSTRSTTPAAAPTPSGSGRRSRSARRSARRCSRGPPTPCAPSGWRQVPGDTRAHYRDALAATHDRGFAVEIWLDPGRRACASWSMLLGDDASTRPVLDRLADELAAHEEFLAVALEPDREYAVNVVNAPVFDHTGQVTLVLSLTGFGRPLRGPRSSTAGARLVDATTTLTTALGDRSRASVS